MINRLDATRPSSSFDNKSMVEEFARETRSKVNDLIIEIEQLKAEINGKYGHKRKPKRSDA